MVSFHVLVLSSAFFFSFGVWLSNSYHRKNTKVGTPSASHNSASAPCQYGMVDCFHEGSAYCKDCFCTQFLARRT
jgi:hypothetical protein